MKIFSLTKKIKWKNYIALFAVSIENLKIVKKSYIFEKTCVSPKIKMKKCSQWKNELRHSIFLVCLKIYNYF